MAESLIPIAEIAEHIINLTREVRAIKKTLRVKDKEFDLGASESPQDIGGVLSSTVADYKTPVTVVTSIIDATTILCLRQIPDGGVAGWIADSQLTSPIEVKVPPGVPIPEVGAFVQPLFTGIYQQFTSGTTVNFPRYGLFNSPSKLRALVKSEGDDTITAALLGAGDVELTTVTVAKADNLRRSFYDGNLINGITYAYVGVDERTATDGSTMISEKITPPYVFDTSIVLVERLGGGGTGISTVVWQDTSPRLWAEVVS